MQVLRDSFYFGIVGTIGFVVDVAVLYALSGFVGLFYGRAVSFLAAVLTTWLLNRKWTFRHRNSGMANSHEFGVYLVLMLVGGAANYASYAWLVITYQTVQANPVIGVAVGSLVGMLFNFAASRYLLFRHANDIHNNKNIN